ncbi:P-loop NTPase fold protein [Pseudoalteromonas sp. R3]|uniref:KAP family P-loop NTPase fold protein n=1 Tax=Pseudoalteromonas sp. R3 TaxID=1709477 RepID=UPI0006B623DC|nr:P-loop NTPase fold protein [Pseudoalteromonas sp. R3]
MTTWQNDQLNRKEEAEFLTNFLLNRFTVKKDAYVLNLDAEWGFGKTYFLQNWKEQLTEIDGCKVVYVNAWESDFSKNPLISFMAAVEDQLSDYIESSEKLTPWWRSALENLAPIASGMVVKKLANMSISEFEELLDEATEEKTNPEEEPKTDKADTQTAKLAGAATTKFAESLIKAQQKVENSISKFVNSIEQVAKIAGEETKPLFIFVDELDRCRPQYAIEMLEVIKHLFSAKGVYFVIATASEQLCESVKVVYGQNFHAKKYLNRFFSQTYTFIEPSAQNYSTYLFSEKISKTENLISLCCWPGEKQADEIKANIHIFATLSDIIGAGLRDMEQAANLIEMVAIQNMETKLIFLPLALLSLLKVSEPEKYTEARKRIAGSTSPSADNWLSNFCLSLKHPDRIRSKLNARDKENIIQTVFALVRISTVNTKIERPMTIKGTTDRYCQFASEDHRLLNLSQYPVLVESAGRFLSMKED